jgi:hypothetical protein
MRCILEEAYESRQWDLLIGVSEAASITYVFAEQTINRSALIAELQHYAGQDVGTDGWRRELLGHHFTIGVPASDNESSITA